MAYRVRRRGGCPTAQGGGAARLATERSGSEAKKSPPRQGRRRNKRRRRIKVLRVAAETGDAALAFGGPALAERARIMRYQALSGACRDAGLLLLLLGHHAAAQADTLAMPVLRGSHTRGLAGTAALREHPPCRPPPPLLPLRLPPSPPLPPSFVLLPRRLRRPVFPLAAVAPPPSPLPSLWCCPSFVLPAVAARRSSRCRATPQDWIVRPRFSVPFSDVQGFLGHRLAGHTSRRKRGEVRKQS